MKKTILTIAMAALCLFSKAQSENKAVDVTAKGIKVGEMIPNVQLNNIHNYKTKTAMISDFQGKLLILDFWATWCTPCVAMRPKMEELQEQFKGKVQFLSVTYQKAAEVLPFLEKLQKGKPSTLPEVMDDQILHRFFPHVYLPHYVWVDHTGKVKAITGFNEVTKSNIELMLSGSDSLLKQKKDLKVNYDRKQPFLIRGNGGDGNNMIFHSILTGYTEGIGQFFANYQADSLRKHAVFTNLELPTIFAYVYAKGKSVIGRNRIFLEVANKATLSYQASDLPFSEWKKKNLYCYELIVPRSHHFKAYDYMQQDLERYFPQYDVRTELRKLPCYVLESNKKNELLKTKGGPVKADFSRSGFKMQNASLINMMNQFNGFWWQNSAYPVVDHTGIDYRVDLNVEADITDTEAINKALIPYGLTFKLKEVEVEVLAIRDKKESHRNSL